MVHSVKEVRQSAEFKEWLSGLRDRKGAARILLRIENLARGNPGDVAPVGGGISELRFHFGPGYRVYYKETGEEIILLFYGGDKSTQPKDILEAKKIASGWEEKMHDSGTFQPF